MPALQYRAVCITDHRAEPYGALPEGVTFLAWGCETAPTTGKKHNQVYAYGAKMTIKKWAKLFGNSHTEPMKGSFKQNEAYCSKESELTKLGEEPMGTGQRRDLQSIQAVMNDLPRGHSVMDAAIDADSFKVCVQYKRGLEDYVSNKRKRDVRGDTTAPEVYVISGAPGTGKTRYVRKLEPDVYDVVSMQWKDGYNLHESVLYDNLEPQDITERSKFLKEIDRYDIQVPIKGGFTTWKPKRIYITSTYTSDQFATHFANPAEWNRRITCGIAYPLCDPNIFKVDEKVNE